jgi:protein phosphatase
LPRRNDILLVCSDGLSNKIGGADMQRIILKNINQMETACSELVRVANERGGEDNISLILARLSGDDLPEASAEEIKIELLNLNDIHDTADQNTADVV